LILILSSVFQRDLTAPIVTQAITCWAWARSCLSRLLSRASRVRVLPRQDFSRCSPVILGPRVWKRRRTKDLAGGKVLRLIESVADVESWKNLAHLSR